MKKTVLAILLGFASLLCSGQKISNIILVGPNGVTTDENEAHSYIVVKHYKEGYFERLDYKKGGPLKKMRTYKDTSMTILDGGFYEYDKDGYLTMAGQYKDNKKVGPWKTYAKKKLDTYIEYREDTVYRILDKPRILSSVDENADTRAAIFPGGMNKWTDYLQRMIMRNKTIDKNKTGGKVILNFTITTKGEIEKVYLFKSVGYFIDEDAINIIEKSPRWDAALIDGKRVDFEHQQAISFKMSVQ